MSCVVAGLAALAILASVVLVGDDLNPAIPASNTCDPSYPSVCIRPAPPDLDCGDIPYRRFTVLPPDPHRFEGRDDGIGCDN